MLNRDLLNKIEEVVNEELMCDDMFEIDLLTEHLLKKKRRFVRRKKGRLHQKRLLAELTNCIKPSIGVITNWNEETLEHENTNRIHRASNSRMQKNLKRQSTRVIRNLPLEALPSKGNYHRRFYDYWGIWC